MIPSPTVLRHLQADRQLRHADRSLYLWIAALRPETVRELSRRVGLSRGAAADACLRLAEAGWLRMDQGLGSARRPVPLVPVECQVELARELEQAYGFAPNKGEFLMRCHLDAWVRSSKYVDNARPSLLANPLSGAALEYDRFYWDDKVAFEFNGWQHYELTEQHPDPEALRQQQARDAIKLARSVEAGIQLVTITPEHLRDGQVHRLIPEGMAVNRPDTAGPYYQTLLRLSQAYAAKASRPGPPGPAGSKR